MLLYIAGYTSISRPFMTCGLLLPLLGPRRPKDVGEGMHPGGVMKYKRRIDVSTLDDVIWTPYTSYGVDRMDEEEFNGTILFLVICNRRR